MKRSKDKTEFYEIIDNITRNKNVQKLKEFKQHYDTSCFEHSFLASYYCFCICKRLGWDYVSATRSAMLHDFFLYDWRVKNGRKGFHAFTHPKVACENASILFDLSKKEKEIILSHMWPISLNMPKSREGFLLTFVDKYCAIRESIKYYIKGFKSNLSFKYAYLLLGFLILRANKVKALLMLSLFR